MQEYKNREQAGRILAELLIEYKNKANTIVLALPRGGVPVAYEIAKALKLPLDLFIVRKLGVPTHTELAFGAIALGGTVVYNSDVIEAMSLTPAVIEKVINQEKEELNRRALKYRGNKPLINLKDKNVILVDDGIATGATMRAAIEAIRKQNPAEIIVAVPVAAPSTCRELSGLVDKLVCPLQPGGFYAVGAHYEQFGQTEDTEVEELLRRPLPQKGEVKKQLF